MKDVRCVTGTYGQSSSSNINVFGIVSTQQTWCSLIITDLVVVRMMIDLGKVVGLFEQPVSSHLAFSIPDRGTLVPPPPPGCDRGVRWHISTIAGRLSIYRDTELQ
jgi:hypothetical protein